MSELWRMGSTSPNTSDDRAIYCGGRLVKTCASADECEAEVLAHNRALDPLGDLREGRYPSPLIASGGTRHDGSAWWVKAGADGHYTTDAVGAGSGVADLVEVPVPPGYRPREPNVKRGVTIDFDQSVAVDRALKLLGDELQVAMPEVEINVGREDVMFRRWRDEGPEPGRNVIAQIWDRSGAIEWLDVVPEACCPPRVPWAAFKDRLDSWKRSTAR